MGSISVTMVLLTSLMVLAISLTSANSAQPSWTTAVNNYVSDLSWSTFLINLIDPNLNDIMERAKLKKLEEKTLDLESNADWIEAIQKSLLRQSHFNTIISEFLKGVTRMIGWAVLGLGLYAF